MGKRRVSNPNLHGQQVIDDPPEGLGGIDEATEAIVVVSDVAVRDLGDQHVYKAR